jgi:hypothetical protein
VRIIDEVDTDNDKKLSPEEFSDPKGFEQLKRVDEESSADTGSAGDQKNVDAFLSVDSDGDNALNRDEIKQKFEGLSDKQVDEIIQRADSDGD